MEITVAGAGGLFSKEIELMFKFYDHKQLNWLLRR